LVGSECKTFQKTAVIVVIFKVTFITTVFHITCSQWSQYM